MFVGGDDLAEGGAAHLRVRVLLHDLRDHRLEGLDLGREVLAAGLGSLEAEAELEVLLVADEDVGHAGDLVERLAELGLASLPEGGAVVEVEGDERAVLLGGLGDREAALGRLGAHGGDEAGEVEDLHAFLAEDALDVVVLRVERAADLAGAVVPHARRAEAEAGVRDVELVAVAPGTALRHLLRLVRDVARAQLGLDEGRHRAALDEAREGEAFAAERARHVQHVRLGACRLEEEAVGVVYRHAVFGCDAQAHGGHACDRVFLLSVLFHGLPPIGWFGKLAHDTKSPRCGQSRIADGEQIWYTSLALELLRVEHGIRVDMNSMRLKGSSP